MVQRIGALRLVAYAMCVSSAACIGQFLLLRPTAMLVQPLPGCTEEVLEQLELRSMFFRENNRFQNVKAIHRTGRTFI